jgi:hypothetical protein
VAAELLVSQGFQQMMLPNPSVCTPAPKSPPPFTTLPSILYSSIRTAPFSLLLLLLLLLLLYAPPTNTDCRELHDPPPPFFPPLFIHQDIDALLLPLPPAHFFRVFQR